MSIIATIDVAARDFALGDVLAANPDLRVHIERTVPLPSKRIPYLFRVPEGHAGDVETALAADDEIATVFVEEVEAGEALVRAEWREDADGFRDALVESGATVLEASAKGDTWTMHLWFREHSAVTDFYRRCQEEEIPLSVRSLQNPGLPTERRSGPSLTDTQRETLLTALEQGYFDVPRRVNLIDLARELGVSDSAVSQRIRRAIATLVETTVAGGDDGVDEA